MLAVARERIEKNGLENKVVLHQAGVVEIDRLFDEKSFDLITSTLVMSELYDEERQWALKELVRILKPDGKLLVVSEVRPKHFLKRAIYYALRFPLALVTYLISQTGTKPVRNLADEIRQAGFEITEERYSFLESFVTVVARRSEIAQPAAVARAMVSQSRGAWITQNRHTGQRQSGRRYRQFSPYGSASRKGTYKSELLSACRSVKGHQRLVCICRW